VTLTPHPLLVL